MALADRERVRLAAVGGLSGVATSSLAATCVAAADLPAADLRAGVFAAELFLAGFFAGASSAGDVDALALAGFFAAAFLRGDAALAAAGSVVGVAASLSGGGPAGRDAARRLRGGAVVEVPDAEASAAGRFAVLVSLVLVESTMKLGPFMASRALRSGTSSMVHIDHDAARAIHFWYRISPPPNKNYLTRSGKAWSVRGRRSFRRHLHSHDLAQGDLG